MYLAKSVTNMCFFRYFESPKKIFSAKKFSKGNTAQQQKSNSA